MNQFYAEQAKLHIDHLKREQPEGEAEITLAAENSPQIEQKPPTVGHPRPAVSLASVLQAFGIGRRRAAGD